MQIRRGLTVVCGAAMIIMAHPRTGLAQAQRMSHSAADSIALLTLEHRWLASHDSLVLEQILAREFRHPVTQGVVLDKAQQIAWAVAHPAPHHVGYAFDDVHIRVYGETAVVNGAVIATDSARGGVTRSLFTDVFVYRGGRWQAVNAQENVVRGGG